MHHGIGTSFVPAHTTINITFTDAGCHNDHKSFNQIFLNSSRVRSVVVRVPAWDRMVFPG